MGVDKDTLDCTVSVGTLFAILIAKGLTTEEELKAVEVLVRIEIKKRLKEESVASPFLQ